MFGPRKLPLLVAAVAAANLRAGLVLGSAQSARQLDDAGSQDDMEIEDAIEGLKDAGQPFKARGTHRESSYRCAEYCPLQKGEKNIAEFRCLNGRCIDIANYCNGLPNCADGSDEAKCPQKAEGDHNCDAGYENWGKEWSLTKKAWCCQHHQRGCPPSAAPSGKTPYTCQAGSPREVAGWSAEKSSWCCSLHGVGCTTTTETTTSTSSTRTTSTSTTQTATSTSTTNTTSTTTTLTTTTETTTSTATTTTTSTTTMTSTTTTTTTDTIAVTLQCADKNINYLPLDMWNYPLTQVDNVAECQDRCRLTPGCAHYSYWVPARHCHLQDGAAIQQFGQLFISGPPTCGEQGTASTTPSAGDALGAGVFTQMKFGEETIPAAHFFPIASWRLGAAGITLGAALCASAAGAVAVLRRRANRLTAPASGAYSGALQGWQRDPEGGLPAAAAAGLHFGRPPAGYFDLSTSAWVDQAEPLGGPSL